MNRAVLIEASFELAAGRCEDLTPLVYARLFREHPDMLALFGADTRDQVKGEMLAKAIQSILDFIGEHHYAAAFIRAEAINHVGFQVPPEAAAPWLDPDDLKLYRLIWERFIASQMLPAVFDVTQVDIENGNGNVVERLLSGFQLYPGPELQALQDLARAAVSRRFAKLYMGFFHGMCREHERSELPRA